MRQDVPSKNPPNTEDEKPNNSLSIIDRLAENGLPYTSVEFPIRDNTEQ